jgi:hypothetical protein
MTALRLPAALERRLEEEPIRLLAVGPGDPLRGPWQPIAPFVRALGVEGPRPRGVAAALVAPFEGAEALTASPGDGSPAELAVTDIDFVRIDAPGRSVELLESAGDGLATGPFGLEVGLELNPLHGDTPDFGTADALLRAAGFELFRFAPYWWRRRRSAELPGLARGQPVWVDALYLRGLAAIVGEAWPVDEIRLVRAISICVVHGLGDYALDLVDVAAGQIPYSTSRSLRNAVRVFDLQAAKAGVAPIPKQRIGSAASWLADRAGSDELTAVYPVALTPDLHERMRSVAERTGLTDDEQIRVALTRWLKTS